QISTILLPRPPTSTLFPYTTLFRSDSAGDPVLLPQGIDERRPGDAGAPGPQPRVPGVVRSHERAARLPHRELLPGRGVPRRGTPDRKSTRLNSSHDQISYAVFCLKN